MQKEESDVEAGSPSGVEMVGCLKRFLQLQDQRVQIYGRFDRGFATHLANGHEGTYQRLCHQITREFSECSKQVNNLEAELRKKGNPSCDGDGDRSPSNFADMIRTVQGQEKRKLEMTAILQVLKKAGRPSERRLRVRSPDVTTPSSSSSSSSSAMANGEEGEEKTKKVGGGGAGSSSSFHGHCRLEQQQQLLLTNSTEGIEGVEEAQLEAEYDGAISEATQALQQSIVAINDQLEEVRYAIAEMEEEAAADEQEDGLR